jgi:hypothetical protein
VGGRPGWRRLEWVESLWAGDWRGQKAGMEEAGRDESLGMRAEAGEGRRIGRWAEDDTESLRQAEERNA